MKTLYRNNIRAKKLLGQLVTVNLSNLMHSVYMSQLVQAKVIAVASPLVAWVQLQDGSIHEVKIEHLIK